VCTNQFHDALLKVIPGIRATKIELPTLDLKIRDFEDQTLVWVIPLDQENRSHAA
jgi:hypothetical protein